MSQAGNVSFSLVDQGKSPKAQLDGIVYVEGITVRGPVNDPKDVITNRSMFKEIFGGYHASDNFPLHCMKMLDQGCSLRVNRITDGTEEKAEFNPVQTLLIPNILVETDELKVTIEGTTITKVFDTSHDNTISLLVTAIKAISGVLDCYIWDPDTLASNDIRYIVVVPEKGGTLEITNYLIHPATGPDNPGTIASKGYIISSLADELFKIEPKYAGADYENLIVLISPASNNLETQFKLTISHLTDSSILEVYDYLEATYNGESAGPSYLSAISNGSQYVNVTYNPSHAEGTFKLMGAATSVWQPDADVEGMRYTMTGGTDGGTPALADYVGESDLKNGFYAFDDYDEAYTMMVPGQSETTLEGLAAAASAYVNNRKDIKYIQEIDPSNTTTTTIIAERNAAAVVSKYVGFIGGGLKIKDPVTSADKNIFGSPDVIYNEVANIKANKPWLSFAGMNHGVVQGALGVVNNFGSPAKYNDLNLLANNQVNMIIQRNGLIMLWDDYSSQKVDSPASFLPIMNLVIWLQKTLKPILESYLSEPCDLPLFKEIYHMVKPTLDYAKDNRGYYGYEWAGDQFVSSLNQMVINKPADVQAGKYKAQLTIVPIPPLKDFKVEIIMQRGSGVTINI